MKLRSRGLPRSNQFEEVNKEADNVAEDRNLTMAPDKESDDGANSRFAIRKLVFVLPKENQAPSEPVTKRNPPPITIPHPEGITINAKETLTKALPKAAFVTRNMNHVTQILANDFTVYSKIKLVLDKNQLKYYEYPQPSKSTRKFVLYGLNNGESTINIEQDLKEYGLQPLEIKQMQLNRPKYEGHANFIISFDSTDHITLKMLQGVKYVCHSVVSWKHYTPPRSDTLQCKNCTRIGHLAHGCHLDPVCMFCAKRHRYTECPLIKQKDQLGLQRIPEFLTKCALCGGQHTAFYGPCPARAAYITRKTGEEPLSLNEKIKEIPPTTRRPPTKKQQEARTEPARARSASPPPAKSRPEWILPPVTQTTNSIIEKHFPTPNESKSYHKKKQAKTNIPTKPFPTTHVSEITTSIHTNKPPVFDNSNYHTEKTSNESFTPQELTRIFHEIIEIATTIHSKADQMQALINLTTKYLT